MEIIKSPMESLINNAIRETELIIEAYEQYGSEFAHDLSKMFRGEFECNCCYCKDKRWNELLK